jgi:hypothetical protein
VPWLQVASMLPGQTAQSVQQATKKLGHSLGNLLGRI